MKVIEMKEIRLDWPDLNLKKSVHEGVGDHVRSSGVHVSGILKHVAVGLGLLSDEDRSDEAPLRMLLGMGWEYACASLYPEMIWQPGEIERDGVIGSPDGASWEEVNGILVPVIDEFKYTFKSLRTRGGGDTDYKDLTQEWLWMQQGMSYCNLFAGGGMVNHVRYHVCWAVGAYTYPLSERYFKYLVEFDERDLAGNWAMLEKHKGIVKGEVW